MLYGKLLFEPRIKHAMNKQHIRGVGLSQGAPGSETVKLPDTIHDYGIVCAAVGAQPWNEAPAIGIPGRGRTQSINRQRTLCQIRSVRRIQGRNFNLVTGRHLSHPELFDGLNGPAACRIRVADNVKYFHRIFARRSEFDILKAQARRPVIWASTLGMNSFSDKKYNNAKVAYIRSQSIT